MAKIDLAAAVRAVEESHATKHATVTAAGRAFDLGDLSEQALYDIYDAASDGFIAAVNVAADAGASLGFLRSLLGLGEEVGHADSQ